jgi:hypothetical protein
VRAVAERLRRAGAVLGAEGLAAPTQALLCAPMRVSSAVGNHMPDSRSSGALSRHWRMIGIIRRDKALGSRGWGFAGHVGVCHFRAIIRWPLDCRRACRGAIAQTTRWLRSSGPLRGLSSSVATLLDKCGVPGRSGRLQYPHTTQTGRSPGAMSAACSKSHADCRPS